MATTIRSRSYRGVGALNEYNLKTEDFEVLERENQRLRFLVKEAMEALNWHIEIYDDNCAYGTPQSKTAKEILVRLKKEK